MGWDNRAYFDIAEYFNHSCDPNLGVLGNNVLVAIKNIQPSQELCFDYAMSEITQEGIGWKCKCGTNLCRGKVRADDWQRPALQKRYGHHFAQYILDKIKETG